MENNYQITKTIRFKLEPQGEIQNHYRELKNNEKKEKEDLSCLIKQSEELIKLLQNLLYTKNKEGEIKKNEDGSNKWRCDLKIKYTWMRTYIKTAFYADKKEDEKPPKHYALADLKYVQQEFDKRWFVEAEEIIAKLKDFQKRTKNNSYEMQRHAQAALTINQFCKRSNFEFVKAFAASLCAINKPDIDKRIDDLRELIDKLETELNIQKANFRPYQSNGVQFAAGSFNYYTVNKSPKMLEKELEKEKNKLQKKIYFEKLYNGKSFLEIDRTYKQHNQILNKLGLGKDLQCKSLEEAYEFLKQWKAEQKKQFMEAIQAKDDKKAKAIKLFESSEDNFNTIKNRVLKIQELANKLNQDGLPTEQKTEYKNELKKIKEEKNDFFNTFTNNPQTPNYKKICDFYKQLAQKRGNIITKIAAIEKDKNIAEQLGYWCVIVEKENKHFLYMIPRDESDNLKNAHEYITKLKKEPNNSVKLHYFNSLTLRSLQKLCFKEADNTFKKSIKDRVCFPEYEQQWKNEPKKIIKFYQDVLKHQTTLDLNSYKGIKEFCDKEFDTIDDFESELNKICYTKNVCISNAAEQKLKTDFKAICFEITSQDLEHNLKYGTENYHNKNHTEIWKSIWTSENKEDNFPLRLNPEIKVMYRFPKPSRVQKYGKGSNLYDEKKKNRYLHEQYTLAVTITDNAHNSKINLAFKDTRDKGKNVNEFNKNFGVDKYNYAMGIDVGTDDLACLCVINKEMKPQMFDVYEIKEDKLGFLKDGTQRKEPYQLIKNPSYFLNDVLYQKTFKESKEDFDKTFAELFEKKQVSALDLTTAKVICGKIILNGDFATHQHLKELNAKRKISQALKINPTVKIYEDNFKWFIEGQKDAVYQSKKIYEYIKPYGEFKQELEEFIKNQQLDDARLEDNINKTRASLVGNMIGVITFLYKQFPGFITLENLKKSMIESHREDFEGDITRPLEWGLYRRFQSECLVPPISELVKLRESERFDINGKKESLTQFGIIKLVSEKETSLQCPKCGNKAYQNSSDADYHVDKEKGVFKCKCCCFNNKTNPGEFASLDTNDKVAAFNIAKRAFKDNN